MKSALLFNFLLWIFLLRSSGAEVISSDRFIFKILDRTISLQDFHYQYRNITALNCIYDDSFVVRFFEKKFIGELGTFLAKFPDNDAEIRDHLHQNEQMLKKLRYFFKILRYSEDQKADVSAKLTKLIRENAKENKCNSDVLYKDSLKTNFISLMEMELYLRSRYGGQLKSSTQFNSVRQSINLFIESLDKQFQHEYYW